MGVVPAVIVGIAVNAFVMYIFGILLTRIAYKLAGSLCILMSERRSTFSRNIDSPRSSSSRRRPRAPNPRLNSFHLHRPIRTVRRNSY
jgi:hypothetical protein